MGLEAAARTARYDALHDLRAELKFDVIATGHTASDQAETLLMRLVRGTSMSGAVGIHAHRADHVIRPLLHLTRNDIEAYVRALQIPHVTDAMNSQATFLRVRMRDQVLPALNTAAGFDTAPALARFSGLAAEDEAFLQRHAHDAFTQLQAGDGLQKKGLLALETVIARRVLARFLGSADVELDAELLDDCLRAAREGTRATLPGDQLLECSEPTIRMIAAPERTKR